VIVIDTNILVYAVNEDAALHRPARVWIEQIFSGTTVVGLPWIVLIAFLRITTNPRIVRSPLPADRSLDYVNEWLNQPYVAPLGPGERHWSIFRGLLQFSGAAGNLTNDAHIAAVAIEHGYTICSTDNDFKRFSGVSHVNPLEGDQLHESAASYR
jgi:toxin-antitoxin system PIN domain toxin